MIYFKNIELQKIDSQQKGKAKYTIDGNEYFAEEAAITYYEKLRYKALWAENTYWATLMSLFFWDVIFAKTRGAVGVIIDGIQTELSPEDKMFEELFDQTIQTNGMPADFFSQDFYKRRERLIENRIQELQHSNLEEKLNESYKKNYGKNCRPIENWNKYKIDELLIAVHGIDKKRLIKILERLMSNFNDNRSGLPDLILYNSLDRDFFFSEVKSENDKISKKQRKWHDFLSTRLGLKVEIFLINHTESQLKKVKASYTPSAKKTPITKKVPNLKEAIISFGRSASKKREEAIRFIQEQESYFTQGEGEEQIYGARFEITEEAIENLYKILDLTSGWKTQKIEIDGEIVKSTNLRNSLWCFREKIKQNTSLDYCKGSEYDNKLNKFGCRNFYFRELEDEEWRDYGYTNTTEEEWMFDHKKINEKIDQEINKLKYCPLFDAKRIQNLVKRIPEKINPKIDKKWAFIDNDYEKWVWHENRWLNTLGETNFPGFGAVVGVQKFRRVKISCERSPKRTKQKSDDWLIEYMGSSKKQKSGCFIATAVYGDSEAYQVKTLKYVRDTHLEKSVLGKLFINVYYKVSPSIAGYIKRHQFLTGLIKSVLNGIVKLYLIISAKL
ncbi:MAG: VRR-NUC domain-containing protein [Nanoarchaeota archaeon]|nr:VRR-NUC domain-containing protein [Nanoarchaeota archaeon]